jgi:hypothetical protein
MELDNKKNLLEEDPSDCCVNVSNTICICEELDQYDEQFIYFCEPIKNNIINNGNFIRILYSKPFILLNGIYLCFSLNIVSVEKYYNKLKCNFNKNEHIAIIEKCKQMEEGILKKMNVNKIAQYKIFEQFKNGNIKIFNENVSTNPPTKYVGPCSFILKISGIWENDVYYGLTFKFLGGNLGIMPSPPSSVIKD